MSFEIHGVQFEDHKHPDVVNWLDPDLPVDLGDARKLTEWWIKNKLDKTTWKFPILCATCKGLFWADIDGWFVGSWKSGEEGKREYVGTVHFATWDDYQVTCPRCQRHCLFPESYVARPELHGLPRDFENLSGFLNCLFCDSTGRHVWDEPVELCATCGGCPECCDSDQHCANCGLPFMVGRCQKGVEPHVYSEGMQ